MNWTETLFNINLCRLKLFRPLKERLHKKVVVAITCVWLLWFYRKPIGNQCCSHCAFATSERSCVEMLGSYEEISLSMEFSTEILRITSHRLPARSRVSISAVFVQRWIDVLSAVWRVFALHTDYESHKCRWSVWDQSTAVCRRSCLSCALALSSHVCYSWLFRENLF